MKKPFTEKERQLLRKSRVAEILAHAAFNHNLTFCDIRKTVDEETFTLMYYHYIGIGGRLTYETSKSLDCQIAWQEHTPMYTHYCERDNFDWDYYDTYYLNKYLPRMMSSFSKDADYWEQYDVLKDSVNMTDYVVTESEIQDYEELLANETLDWGPTDNDIAVETYEEMRRVGKIRQLAISAYNKGINTLTVIRFMNEKLANDAERGIFLESYALSSFWDGYESNSD